MFKYVIGQKIDTPVNREGVTFNVDDSGATLVFYYHEPTKEEIESIREGAVELGLLAKQRVLMTFWKFGDLEWQDAPYNVHLSTNLTKFEEVSEGTGLGLTVMLVDISSKELKAIRLIGLPTDYSNKIISEIEKQKDTPFSQELYTKELQLLFNYSTNQLLSRAVTYKL